MVGSPVRVRLWFSLACLAAACLAAAPALALITTSGAFNPSYPETNPDPWNVGGTLYVGYSISSGWMTVDAGSDVVDTTAFLGYGSGFGIIGRVTITGSGSTWKNTADLFLGHPAASGYGQLTLSDYGSVYVGDVAQAGAFAGDLTVSGSSSDGAGGGRLYVYQGSTITNAGSAVVGDERDEYGWATVDGAGSSWTNSKDFIVGNDGTGTLTIQNGGNVKNVDGLVANWVTAPRGTVLVTGSGSTWECTGNLSLGRAGASYTGVATMTIASSGTVYVGDAARTDGVAGRLTISDGDSSGAQGGRLSLYHGSTLDHHGMAIVGAEAGEYGWAAVDGAGSSWTNGSSLYVGSRGSGTLAIQNGGSVSCTTAWVGYWGASAVGSVIVNGIGSTWTCTGNLSLGQSSNSGVGSITISGGGSAFVGDTAHIAYPGYLIIDDSDGTGAGGGHLYVYNGSTLIHEGHAALGDDYAWATVDGAGSSWSNSGDLGIGGYGFGWLTVRNGGRVSCARGALGWDTGGVGTVTVDGANSTWVCTRDLKLGDSSVDGVGSLTISGGGAVCVGDAAGVGATGRSLVVSDVDDTGSDGGRLYVQNGSTITNAGSAVVGDERDEYGWATVDGAGSSWTNAYLYVGDCGSGAVTVQNHGSLASAGAMVGGAGSATGEVTVTGEGSSWTNAGSIRLGEIGSGTITVQDHGNLTNIGELNLGLAGSGMLLVESGGTVSDTNAFLAVLERDSSGTAIIDGPGSSWTNSGTLSVGEYGSGELAIRNGGNVSNTDAWVGLCTGATGTVTVNASTWECTGDLSLGQSSNSGVGHVTVSNSGTLYVGDAARVAGIEGLLTVSDSDASGTAGGRLQLYNGSTMASVCGGAMVGKGPGKHGWVTVDGPGSAWTNEGQLYLGLSGGSGALTVQNGGSVSTTGSLIFGTGATGALTVQGGGSVSNADSWFGETAGAGTAIVEGPGSIWQCTGTLWLGFPDSGGGGHLTISNGGKVAVGDSAVSIQSHALVVSDSDTTGATGGRLGVYYGSTLDASEIVLADDVDEYGGMTVDGPDSSCTTNLLMVGEYGSGTLTIQNSGRVTAGDVRTGAAAASTGSGSITVDNGTLNVAGCLAIAQTGLVDLSAGTITADTIDDPDGGFHWTGGRLSVGTFLGDLDNPAGTLAPGGSAGLTDVSRHYVQGAAAVLEIELFGTDPAEYDRLHVNSLMALAGTLDVQLADGFTLAAGDTFDVLDWGGLVGKFDALLLPEPGDDLIWYVGRLYTTGELSVGPLVPGDATMDGRVDEDDARRLAANWGQTDCGWSQGSFNDDGVVNAADASILAANWGYGTGGESNTVPEPAACVLLLGLIPGFSRRRRRDGR